MSAQTSKSIGISITDGGKKAPVLAAAPPVEAGLDEKCDKIARGACSNWDAGVPHLVAKAFAAFIRLRDAEQQRVNEAEIFRLTINHLRFIKAEESNRELVENLEELRKYAEHKAGCDFLRGEREIDCSCGLGSIKESVRAVLAARNEGGGR